MWPFPSSYPEVRLEDLHDAYDYIIIGGGTAGCVLANRLSADNSKSVLVVERGPVADSWAGRVPLLSANFHDGRRSLLRTSTVQPALGRACELVTGCALGGTSRINQMAYTRGLPAEYDAWRKAGRVGWAWEDVKPFFLKGEGAYGCEPAVGVHNSQGEWQHKPLDKFYFRCFNEVIDACKKISLPYIPDLNSLDSASTGCGHIDFTIDHKSHRNSTFHAFLPRKLVRQRRNLHICTNTLVEKLMIDRNEAGGLHIVRGVQLVSLVSKKRITVNVVQETVLSAGPFGNPQILMLSGIGPANHLKEHGLPIIKDLPAVGSNLDHFGASIAWEVPMSESLICLEARPWVFILELLRYLIWGTGLLLGPVVQLFVLLNTHALDHTGMPAAGKTASVEPLPDIELIPIAYDHSVEKTAKDRGIFSILVALQHPKSHGTVRLTSPDPFAALSIDMGYLSNPADLVPLRAGLKCALRIVERMRRSGYKILSDWAVPRSESDEDLDTLIVERGVSSYHYSSTCRMAPEDDGGVVDDELKVHGVCNLRIADTSVFPWIPATHLQAPAVAVAEKCAHMVVKSAGGDNI